MPFDSRSVVAETVPADSVELCSNQRSGCKGGFGGGMDHTSTDRTWTSDSEAGASSIDAIQLNNICSASESSSSPDQPVAATEALESPSFNKALKRDEGVDRGAEMDNSPTASTSKGEAGGGGGGPTSLPESLKYPRKSLPLLPRMNQYERHPLLQVRPGAGLSEFELFLLEKDLFKKRCSVDDQQQHHSSESVDVKGVTTPPYCIGLSYPSRPGRDEERKLIPRSAHYEPHPLLRKSVSGVCELELYLMEKNEEAARKQRRAAADDDDDERTNDYDDNDDDDDDTTPATTKRRQIRSKLEPRLNQWEKHALLEVKDKSGLSEVDRLFLETEQEQQQQQERGKCAAECVCKGATCKRCKKKQRQQQQQTVQSPTSSVQQTMDVAGWRGDSSKTSDDSSSAASAAPLLCQKQPPPQHGGHQTKRVHFERQKNDADDSGIASSDASCPATRQDDVSASEATPRNSNATTCSRQPKKDAEDGDEIGRDGADAADDRRNKRALRTDKQQPGNKSCCMS